MVTETILGYDRDGKLAFSNLIKTRADGHWQMTSFDDDGNGTIDRSQRYEFFRAADGSRTRNVSNIAAEGILTSSAVTWTSPYGNWMINTLDEDGDGNVDQSTDLLIGTDGSTVSLTKTFSDNNKHIAHVATQPVQRATTKSSPPGGSKYWLIKNLGR